MKTFYMNRLFLFLLISLAMFSCKSKNADSPVFVLPQQTNGSGQQHVFDDGTWCAVVEYYNPNSGANMMNRLNVEVKNGELTLIHWRNDVRLNHSLFDPELVDKDGTVCLESDKGYAYMVTLESKGGCNYLINDSEYYRKDFSPHR
jgi:hypothetical protein